MGGQVYLGHRSYGTPIVRGDISDVYVGKYCSIAQNVIVDCGFHHNTDFATTYPLNVFFDELKHITGHPKSKGDICIGNDVWIAEGTIIMGGITIGDGAVVGAGSIVTRNVNPYEVVVGNPAKYKKHRIPICYIGKMLNLKWWDWEEEKIIRNGELLMSNNIQKLIDENTEIR